MRDFKVDIGISNMDHGKLERFCSLFNLKILIKKETCIIQILTIRIIQLLI